MILSLAVIASPDGREMTTNPGLLQIDEAPDARTVLVR
jgi:hypothetical protein